ncbi:immunoglobulin superfamily DCC subclass member 4 isoform X4 [Salvelinus namaycush]|uniref:immunoglobulin superfamily DCC subclass member 4 isoform X3 n=1 Tax=Salvelinus namaycush TaxID=8040 RepID=UPI0019011510|nr:immunoglobulin superfamily DCC subclass member 4 isoform X3 [Salvelinus namaycush]XP_038847706.1 immunoglobulin superfamily DCC subclass member 4 isoform X4 [Salvelinus namaycush]
MHVASDIAGCRDPHAALPLCWKSMLYMAVEAIWVFYLLSLGFCGPSVQEKPVTVELSCGAGPVLVVLEPGQPLLLDCHLGATSLDTPLNVTWLQDGLPVLEGEGNSLRTLANGSLLVLPTSMDGRTPQGVEGGYSCVSAGPFGALTSRTIAVHLATLSRFHQDPEAQVVPLGGASRFECQIDGVPTPRITWEKDQEPIPSQPRFISLPNGVLQILGAVKEDGGAYRCVASNSARKRFSQDAILTVTTGPGPAQSEVVIVAPPQNATVVQGRPAVMECMAQGGQPKPLVSWSRQDGKPIATDVVVLETNLVIPNTRRYHAGVYVCRANKPKTREFVIAAAELHVPAPPVILQPPETVSLSRGNTARFVCNSSGEPPPALHWLKNGKPVKSNGRVKTQSPGVLLINQLGLDDAGYYQCIADNALGTACATAKLSVIVREGLPSPPHQLSATPHSSTTALLTWERPEHNRDQIIGFSVHYQPTSGSDHMEYQFAVNNDTTEYHVKELLPHTAYTFYVVAYSPMGASRPSLPVTVEMLEDVPSAPPQLSLLSTSPTDIRVMWLPLSSQHSRGAVTRYRIDYSTLEQGEHIAIYWHGGHSTTLLSCVIITLSVDNVFSVEVGGNETQLTLRELQPNQAYRLRMAAGTGAGFGVPSEWSQHHTPAHFNHSMVIFAPTELKVRAKMNSLHVTWQPPPNHTQISGYKLFCREVVGEELTNGETHPERERVRRMEAHTIKLRKRVKHHEVSSLVPDRLYEVKVWAFNKQTDGYAAGWKGRTEKAHGKAPPKGNPPPLPPSSIKATANSSTSIWLRWEKPRFSNVRIINYTVRCSPAGIRNASLVSYYTSSAQEILLGALKPYTRYELAVQSIGGDVVGPFSGTVEESTLTDVPSTPPAELQLSALDSSSVLVNWRTPVEPNGIIISYRILYTINLSQPEHLWNNLSQDGGWVAEGTIMSAEVTGLSSGTQYFFKMRASTEVGVGPYSPVKDVRTPPRKYELDIHAVTGIIVGVCLGLLSILLCMCVSFRNGKAREVSGGLDSTALPPQYRRGGRSVPTMVPECSDCHELETLMPLGSLDHDHDLAQPLTEPTEEHSLMGNVGVGDDALGAELKAAWNGSVSCNWANRITKYRDTITEDSPTLNNGTLDMANTENGKGDPEDRLGSSLCSSNQVEAEVIVHSELNDLEKEQQEARSDKDEDSQATRGPSLSEAAYSPVRQPAQAAQHPGEPVRQPAQAPQHPGEPVRQPAQAPQHPSPGEESLETQPLPKVPPGPVLEPVFNHNGQPEGMVGGMVGVAAQLTVDVGRHTGTGLTNGFHSTKPLRTGQETLGNGDSRHCPPLPSPSPFVSTGLVHSNSAAHSYLCP